jgi:hypothetical protein
MASKTPSKAEASAALAEAVDRWRAAKSSERAAREALAVVVRQVVNGGIMNESKVATLTKIPRMTIRKMLGKG